MLYEFLTICHEAERIFQLFIVITNRQRLGSTTKTPSTTMATKTTVSHEHRRTHLFTFIRERFVFPHTFRTNAIRPIHTRIVIESTNRVVVFGIIPSK